MNSIAAQKCDVLVKQIEEQDLKILQAAVTENELLIRNSIDHRRQLLALLERELMAKTGRESADVGSVYQCDKDISEYIDLWCSRVNNIAFTRERLSDVAFCNFIIDSYIPKSWNWLKDVIILIEPLDETLVNALILRGQKNIVLFSAKEQKIKITKSDEKFDHVAFAHEHLELADTLSKINTRVRHVTTLHCDPQHPSAQETFDEVQQALKLGRKTAQIKVNTSARFGLSWAANLLTNLQYLAEHPNLSALCLGDVKHAVVVAPGPSLQKNVEHLKEVQDHVLIVTVLRAVSILERHGIRPDLVVQIDALNEEDAQYLSANPPKNMTTLFLEGAVNPVLFRLEAKQKIWSLLQDIPAVHQMFRTKPTPFSAPSVALYASSLCQHLGVNSICLLGQDLAVEGDSVYAVGATDHLQQIGKELPNNIDTPGFWGGLVKTRDDFAFYIEQYEILAEQWKKLNPDLSLINATEGGAFINGFEHMRFEDFIKSQNFTVVDKKIYLDAEYKSSLAKSSATLFLKKTALELGKIISLSSKIIALDQQPDFNTGRKKKLRKFLDHFRELNGRVPLLELAMQQEITETVGNAKSTSSVPSYAEFFQKVRSTASKLENAIKKSWENEI